MYIVPYVVGGIYESGMSQGDGESEGTVLLTRPLTC